MRSAIAGLMMVAILAMAGVVMAEDAAPKKPARVPGLKGEVVSVNVEKATVTIKVGKADAAKEVTVATNAETKIKVDGKEGSKLEDLKAGMKVSVTPVEGVATAINAVTPTKEAPKHKEG